MSSSNSAQFEPMPKRFIVWDTKYKKFLTQPMRIWQIVVHFRNKFHQLYDDNGDDRYIFCQSTNLFDEDDEEIFDGSIIRDFGGAIGVVYYDREDGGYRAKSSDRDSFGLTGSSFDMKVLGHILSNPELFKEAK